MAKRSEAEANLSFTTPVQTRVRPLISFIGFDVNREKTVYIKEKIIVKLPLPFNI